MRNLIVGEHTVLVDDADYEVVARYNWFCYKHHIGGTWYCYGNVMVSGMPVSMHIFLMGKPSKGFEWNHIDNNGLNNQRHNLELVTQSLNKIKAKLRADNPTGFRCISWDKARSKWIAFVYMNGATLWRKRFYTIKDAIKARESYIKENNLPHQL